MQKYAVKSEDVERIYEYFVKTHHDAITVMKYYNTKEWKEYLIRNIDNVYHICDYCGIPVPKWFDDKYHILREQCLKEYGVKLYFVPVK